MTDMADESDRKLGENHIVRVPVEAKCWVNLGKLGFSNSSNCRRLRL